MLMFYSVHVITELIVPSSIQLHTIQKIFLLFLQCSRLSMGTTCRQDFFWSEFRLFEQISADKREKQLWSLLFTAMDYSPPARNLIVMSYHAEKNRNVAWMAIKKNRIKQKYKLHLQHISCYGVLKSRYIWAFTMWPFKEKRTFYLLQIFVSDLWATVINKKNPQKQKI